MTSHLQMHRPFSYSEKECEWNDISLHFVEFSNVHNGPFSYSEKESQSNDTLLHSVESSNVHSSDRSSKATPSSLTHENV